MTTEPEISLRQALQSAYPASEPSDALGERVAALADASLQTRNALHQRSRRHRLRLLGAGATVLVILTLLLLPRLDAVLALTRMANSLRDVRSVHSVEWQIAPDGKRTKIHEQWYQAGNWRVEDAEGHFVQVCAGGRRWVYSRGENTVTLDHAAFPVGYQNTSGFSVTASVQDAVAVGVRMNVQMLGAAVIQGHAVHWMQVSDNKYPDARSQVAVEDATGLPLQSATEERVHGVWTRTLIGASQYDLPLAASLFKPDFPKTARLIDVEAGRGLWYQKLAKGVAAQTRGNDGYTIDYSVINGINQSRMVPLKGPRRVVVRDFEANKSGDVFLLFTNGTGVGSGDNVRDVDLTDEYGTKYISWEDRQTQPGVFTDSGPQQFIPTCYDADPQDPSGHKLDGYLFNKEQLVGRWWVPLNPQEPGEPHHFTLTLHEDFNPGLTTFHLPIEKPICSVIPEYMPYMARPLMDGWEVPHAEAITRGEYYAGDGHDPAQALAWYQKAIAIDQDYSQKIGSHYGEEDEWFAIYQIQSQLGKTEEAKAALRNANRDAVYAGPTRDKIRAEMDKLGLDP